MRSIDYRTRVFILSSFIVVLLIAGGIGLLYYLNKHPKTNEVPAPTPAPIVEQNPEENKPVVVPPSNVAENQSPQNEGGAQAVQPPVKSVQKPSKTPVSGPE